MFRHSAIKTTVIHSDSVENVNGILLLRCELGINWQRSGTGHGNKRESKSQKNKSFNSRLIMVTRLRADLIPMLFGQLQ